jgi:hypothetical protein
MMDDCEALATTAAIFHFGGKILPNSSPLVKMQSH